MLVILIEKKIIFFGQFFRSFKAIKFDLAGNLLLPTLVSSVVVKILIKLMIKITQN